MHITESANQPNKSPSKDDDALRDLAVARLNTCITHLNQSKINRTNAFHYRMGGYIMEAFNNFESTTEKSNEQLWKQYSTGIDSCAKIYGLCVDSVYNDLYKILGEVTRSKMSDFELGKGKWRIGEKGLRRRFPGHLTLEMFDDSIVTKKFDVMRNFDPYFKKMSAKFDACSISGLLSSHLLTNNNLELILESANQDEMEIEQDEGEAVYDFPLPERPTQESLFPVMEEFEHLKLKAETNGRPSVNRVIMNFENSMTYDLFSDLNHESALMEYEFNHKDNKFNIEDYGMKMRDRRKQHTLVENLEMIKNAQNNDYEFFNRSSKLSTWAGFEYWEKLHPSRTRRRYVKNKSVKQHKKTPFAFKLNKSFDKSVILNCTSRSRTYHTDEYFLKINKKKPVDYGISLQTLSTLYTKPSLSIQIINQEVPEQPIIDHEEFGLPRLDDEDFYGGLHSLEYNPDSATLMLNRDFDINYVKERLWEIIRYKLEVDSQVQFKELLQLASSRFDWEWIRKCSEHSLFMSIVHLAAEKELLLTETGVNDFVIRFMT